MTIQHSVAVRNAKLDVWESTIGASAILKIRTGAQPSDCAQADSGSVLATIALPSDWMNAASGGQKTMSGSWADNNADGSGTAGHYRLYASDGTTCHEQGSITVTGGGGDMTLDSVNFTAGQTLTITGFSKTAGNP